MTATKKNTFGELVSDHWLEISEEGFATENRGRDVCHLAKELVQNALDAVGDDGLIVVSIEYDKVGKAIKFMVRDTGEGIANEDMTKIRTVFHTSKTDSRLKRGRFGRGLKECLCLARTAEVVSGTTVLTFVHEDGEHRIYRSTREVDYKGTIVSMMLPWKEVEVDRLVAYFQTFLVPEGVELTVNHVPVARRQPKFEAEASLPTETFEGGMWIKPTRKTKISIVPTRNGEGPLIYEMGIPVCSLEWDFPYHINVQQRIAMNPKRDAVASGYPAKLHKAAIPLLLPELSAEEVLSDTVGAVAPHLTEDVQKEIIRKGFGDNIVRQVPAAGRRDFNADAEELGKKTINTQILCGGLREIVKDHVPTARDVVHEETQKKVVLATTLSFAPDAWDKAKDEKMKKQRAAAIKECGGKERVELVMDFATWFVRELLSIYDDAVFNGTKLAVFPDATIATWDDNHTLTLGLNFPSTFLEPFSADSLTTLVHESAHLMNAHHGCNFYKEIEVLSGQAARVMAINHKVLTERFEKLLEEAAR